MRQSCVFYFHLQLISQLLKGTAYRTNHCTVSNRRELKEIQSAHSPPVSQDRLVWDVHVGFIEYIFNYGKDSSTFTNLTSLLVEKFHFELAAQEAA